MGLHGTVQHGTQTDQTDTVSTNHFGHEMLTTAQVTGHVQTARGALIAATAFLSVALAAPAGQAQEAEHIQTHRDWHAWQYQEDGNNVCFVVSKPIREEGEYTRRGDVFVHVTHRPGEQSESVVSFITGYTYEPGSDVRVDIGGQEFVLFTDDDMAWTHDAEQDGDLVGAMKAGAEMVVSGVSNRGTRTTDTYSLMGFTAAMGDIDDACDF